VIHTPVTAATRLLVVLLLATMAARPLPAFDDISRTKPDGNNILYINSYSVRCGIPNEQWHAMMEDKQVVMYAEFPAEADAWLRNIGDTGKKSASILTDIGGRWIDSQGFPIPERYSHLSRLDESGWMVTLDLTEPKAPPVRILSTKGLDLQTRLDTRITLPDTCLHDNYIGRKSGHSRAVYSPDDQRTYLVNTRRTRTSSPLHKNVVARFINNGNTASALCVLDSAGTFLDYIGEFNSTRLGGIVEADHAWIDDSLLVVCDGDLCRLNWFSRRDLQHVRSVRTPQSKSFWEIRSRRERAVMCSSRNGTWEAMRNRLLFGSFEGDSVVTRDSAFAADPVRNLFMEWGNDYDAEVDSIDMDPDAWRVAGELLETMGIWADVKVDLEGDTVYAADAYGHSLCRFDLDGRLQDTWDITPFTAKFHAHESPKLKKHEDTHPLFRLSRIRWITVRKGVASIWLTFSESEKKFHPGIGCLLEIDLEGMQLRKELYFEGLQPYAVDGHTLRCLTTEGEFRMIAVDVR
jgi:hypothetical protein